MAATVGKFYFVGTNGVPFHISIHNPANAAVGTYLYMDQNQEAVATSPQQAFIGADAYLVDYVAGPATGVLELMVNGKGTAIMLDNASYQAGNAGRPALKIPFNAGKMLMAKVIGLFPA